MSIYSGFATRQIEQTYNIMQEQLLQVLQRRLLEFYQQEEVNEQVFIDCVKKLLTQMSFFERQKHLPPKFSDNCRELSSFLKINTPSNKSLFNQKKNKSQNFIIQKNHNEQQKINQSNKQEQQYVANTLFYGEPQQSEINLKRQPFLNSLSQTTRDRNDIFRQPKSDFVIIDSNLFNETQETNNNYIILEAEQNNSSSSVSSTNSFHSSFASLDKKQKSSKIHLRTKKDEITKNNDKKFQTFQSEETKQNLTQQISSLQKEIIQQNHDNPKNINASSFNIDSQIKLNLVQNSISNHNSSIQNKQNGQEKLNSAQILFKVTKKQPQQINQVPSSSSSQVQSNIQTNQTLSPTKQLFVTPQEIKQQSLKKIQNIQNDEMQTFQEINKKKNRSHSTRRQRMRNQILNQVYLSGEDSSNHQYGYQTSVVSSTISRRSRSSYRSLENPHRYNLSVKQTKQQQENVTNRTISIENQKSVDLLRQLSLLRIQKERKINSHENIQRNKSFINYNPSIQNNLNNENSNKFIKELLRNDNSGEKMSQEDQQLYVGETTATSSDVTLYQIRSQMDYQFKQLNSNEPNIVNQNNNSQMAKSSNSRIEKYNLILNSLQTDFDKEPQISKISQKVQNQVIKQDRQININFQNYKKQIKQCNNSTLELNCILHPQISQDQNLSYFKSPQKLRNLQNNSLNNSFLSTQNNGIGSYKKVISGTESYNFDLMYKNNYQSKRPSGSLIYSKNLPNTIAISNSSKIKLNLVENGHTIKTSNSGFEKSKSEDHIIQMNDNENISFSTTKQ